MYVFPVEEKGNVLAHENRKREGGILNARNSWVWVCQGTANIAKN